MGIAKATVASSSGDFYNWLSYPIDSRPQREALGLTRYRSSNRLILGKIFSPIEYSPASRLAKRERQAMPDRANRNLNSDTERPFHAAVAATDKISDARSLAENLNSSLTLREVTQPVESVIR